LSGLGLEIRSKSRLGFWGRHLAGKLACRGKEINGERGVEVALRRWLREDVYVRGIKRNLTNAVHFRSVSLKVRETKLSEHRSAIQVLEDSFIFGFDSRWVEFISKVVELTDMRNL